jgi:hypothetical protein
MGGTVLHKTWLIVGLVLTGLYATGCAKTMKDVEPVFTSAGWYKVPLKKKDGEPVTNYNLWINEVDSDHSSAQHAVQNMAAHARKLKICFVPNMRLEKYTWSMTVRETDEAGTIKDGTMLESYTNTVYTRVYGNTYDCWTTKKLPATRVQLTVTEYRFWEVK